MFVLLANFVVDQYGRGVLRAAVDEGARAGAQEGNTLDDCQARAAAVTGDLLRGSLGSTVQILCGEANGTVTSRATAAFPGWLPGVPTWNVAIEGRSTREQGPS